MIATDNDNGTYYLDLKTVERPDSNTVIYWCKVEYPSSVDPEIRLSDERLTRIKMFRKRKFIRIDKPNYRIQDVAPETIVEAFYMRLFR